MLRKWTLVLSAVVGLLAVGGSGAGAESASRLPYDFVLASYTVGDGTSVFINAWRAGDGGRTHGLIRLLSPPQNSRVCLDVEANEAYVTFEFRVGGGYVVDDLLLRDNRDTGEPDVYHGLYPPEQGRLPRRCIGEFDGFGQGLHGIPVVSGDISIHDG